MNRQFKLGSLFDGSGGFPLAAAMCGGVPVLASEIEPYPIAVTRSRFPDMPHLGNVSKINGAEIEPVDVLSFGSPCQDMSVAGKRAGLKHEDNGDDETTRSGLFFETIRIIKEMREATNGRYPTFAVWENVPGAFSSNKGEDFKAVLDSLCKIKSEDYAVPPHEKRKWDSAGSIVGEDFSLAWRVFDAQYWGVPQRRRRIYLVIDFRGERAGKILFERKGLRGHFETGRTPWQGAAGDAENGIGADDCNERIICMATQQGGAESGNNQPVVCLQGNGIDRADTAEFNGCGWREDVCYTLNTIDRPAVCYSIDRAFFNQGENAQYATQVSENGICQTLVANGPSAVCYKKPYQKVTGPLMANSHPGSYCGQDAYTDMLICGETPPPVRYIVRRLTPTECARLQGFPDWWGNIDSKTDFTDDEYRFWLEVRNTYAAINGKTVKDYTKAQMLTWYNNLHTDSAEYKMWGNGIALPNALYVMQGIAEALEATV